MKQLFERTSSYWVRYDKYVIRTDAKGVKYITAAPDAKPQIIDPLEDTQTMALDALNAGRLFFGKKAPEREQEAGILRFVHRYGPAWLYDGSAYHSQIHVIRKGIPAEEPLYPGGSFGN